MSKYIELREKLNAKRAQLNEIFEKKPGLDFTEDEVKDIQARNAELTDLGKEFDAVRAVEDIRIQNERELKELDEAGRKAARLPFPDGGMKYDRDAELESLGRLFTQSASYKAYRPGQPARVEVSADYKTLLTLTGWPVRDQRIPRLQQTPQNPNRVADLIPQGTTDASGGIVYLEETTFTNAAATVAEGGTKPESALAFTERTSPIRKIATVLPITDELMQDVAGLETYLNQRMRLMVQLTEDAQLVSGTGVSPQITGLLNVAGIQTQAKAADPGPDAVYKAMTKIRVNAYGEPSGVIFHPTNWQDIRLLRTADGLYIWGNPSEAGPERIWGLPVAQNTAMTLGTALVGDFQAQTQIFRKQDIQIAASTEHSTFFVENKIMLRAEERLALVVYRPAALCTVTGL